MNLQARWLYYRWTLSTEAEKLLRWFVWRLPKTLVYWCFIRVAGHATTGEFGDQEPGKLDVMTALQRWGDPRGGDPAIHRKEAHVYLVGERVAHVSSPTKLFGEICQPTESDGLIHVLAVDGTHYTTYAYCLVPYVPL